MVGYLSFFKGREDFFNCKRGGFGFDNVVYISYWWEEGGFAIGSWVGGEMFICIVEMCMVGDYCKGGVGWCDKEEECEEVVYCKK